MAVEPLNWIAWPEARDRMPEIWDGWRYQLSHADRAMVNSLRRGNVSHRGEAYEPGRRHTKPIALRDVVAGLLSLRTRNYSSLFAHEAEYEATEWGSVLTLGGNHQMRPMTVKKTAMLDGAELAWDEFRDDLIRFELPAGVKPARKRGPEPRKLRRYEAADRALFPEIRRLIKRGESPHSAALELARHQKVKGYGSNESKAKRVAKLFLQKQRLIGARKLKLAETNSL